MGEDIGQSGGEIIKPTREEWFQRKRKPSEIDVKVIAWMDLKTGQLYSADRKWRLYGDWETAVEMPGYHIEYCKTVADYYRYAYFKDKV